MKTLPILQFGFFVFLFSSFAFSQNATSGGAGSGRVTDSSGAIVRGATVRMTNNGTGVQLSSMTNASGIYSFPTLPVGSYTLSINQTGFKPTQVQNVVVQIGQTTAQDVQLQVGGATETVTVTATTPLLRPTDSSASTVVDQELIADLPLSGRRYTDFVLLTPNATADGQFGLVSVGGQQGGADSGYANGNGSNSFTVDGANDTSNYFGDARGRTRVPYIFGEQSIQEFQVADNPYSAAYGGGGTGFINTVTKSGTDKFHGDAFYYNRNSGTGANDAVDKFNHVPKPLNVLQQFGADLGGPIVKDKAFFYFDYEQQRQKEPISVISSDFASLQPSDFDNVPAGTALPAPNSAFPVPQGFSSAPAPGDPTFPAYLQQVSNALNAIDRNLGQGNRRRDDLSFFPKVDWQLTDKDHLTFLYNYNRFNSPGGTFTFNPVSSPGVESLSNNFVRDHHASVHSTHVFTSNLLNDFHVSYLRDEQIGTPSGLLPATFPNIFIFSPTFLELGTPTFAISNTKEFQFEIGEQVNYLVGRHDLKFGFDYNRTHVTDVFPGNFLGTFAFGSPTNFALGRYIFYSQGGGNPKFPFTFPYYGFYVQDKFKVNAKLTLDLGIREDFQVFPQPVGNPAFPESQQFPNQYQRISPRLGFAFQPYDKLVVRGGAGLFYQIFNGINYENSVISNGSPLQQATANLGFNSALPPNQQTAVFPTQPSSGLLFSGSTNISMVDPHFKTPSVVEANLEVQDELAANTTLTFGSMWTHGTHLIASTAFDLNQLPPSGTTTYVVCPAGTDPSVATSCNGSSTIIGPNLDSGLVSEGRVSSTLGQINALISPGSNNYNALYVQLQRRMSRGLSIQAAYTYSKNTQTAVDFFNQFDLRDTHGLSLLDQRHRFSLAVVYSPDASGISSAIGRRLLSNYTISTVMQFNSGRPYTGLLNSAAAGDSVNNSAFNQTTGNTAAGINGGGAPSPDLALNSFIGPGIDEVDLGIARDFHLTERQVITLKAQAFNLMNHPNFFVQEGRGINQTQFDPFGATCGDGASANQTCFLAPHPGFQDLQSVSELNGPRVFQFSFGYRF